MAFRAPIRACDPRRCGDAPSVCTTAVTLEAARRGEAGLGWLWPGAAALAACVAGPVYAQPLEQYLPAAATSFTEPSSVPVLVRPSTGYDPLGVRAGEFIIRPRVDESFGYDDNPIGLTKSRGSSLLTNAAGVDAVSDFSRNSVNLSLGLNDRRYFDLPQQSRTDYTASGGTTIDIGRSKLALQGSYLALHEDGTDIDSTRISLPLAYVAKQLQATYTIDYGSWQFQPGLSYLSYRFKNITEPGQTFSERARNRDVFAGSFTVRFNVQENRNLLVTVRTSDTNYVGPLGGQARPDSFAYEALAGTDYAVSGNLRFLVLVGYELRQFSAPHVYKNQATPVVEASAIWTPTGLTTVTGSASRSVVDSIGESTTGVVYSRAGFNVDHELRRNIVLSGNAGVELAEFNTGNAGLQTLYHLGAGVRYLINRNLQVKASYNFEDRLGSSVLPNTITVTGPANVTVNGNGAYTRNILLLTLTATL